MEFKARLIGTLLLFIIVGAPSFSAGKLQVKSMESDVYDIDYRGPETHTYLPPPNLAAHQPKVDTIAGLAHHGSRVREVQKHQAASAWRDKHFEKDNFLISPLNLPRRTTQISTFCLRYCVIRMANFEESNPLLPKQHQEFEATKDEKKPTAKNGADHPPAAVSIGWTADGLPVGEVHMQRSQWDSGIFACLGRTDGFCSSDLEVCLLGSIAPCLLYGSNVERLGSTPGTFANHCLPYTALYLIGNSFFGGNCLAPWFSYPTRTAMRRKFNLEGSCEAFSRSCGCCGSFVEDEVHREQCETACDFATHVFCHPCALCQEGREVRRRLHHPGFNTRPVLAMIPPGGQTMGRLG